MTKLTLDQVRHLAKLARLTLTPEEETRFCKELTDILRYVEILQQVNTDGVEALSQVTGLENVYREDCVVREECIPPDSILRCSPLPIVEHQIQTPSAHG